MSGKLIGLCIIFTVSGACINLLGQQLYYGGGGNEKMLTIVEAVFCGMMVAGFLNEGTRNELQGNLTRRLKQIWVVSACDVTSLTLRAAAQNHCGSGMFTVIYASLPVFNGILSFFLLGRVLSVKQWASMLVVVAGLAFSVLAEEASVSGSGSGGGGGGSGSKPGDGAGGGGVGGGAAIPGGAESDKALHEVIFGIVLALGGTLMASGCYVSGEMVLKGTNAPKEPSTMTALNGLLDFLFALPWLLFYSIPNRQALLYDSVDAHQQHALAAAAAAAAAAGAEVEGVVGAIAAVGNSTLAAVAAGHAGHHGPSFQITGGPALFAIWLLLAFSNGAHNQSMYAMLQISDSITLCMLQGLRAVMVFFVSAALYCSDDAPEQCFSSAKAVSALIVVAGVVCYARSSPAISAKIAKDASAKQLSPMIQPSKPEVGQAAPRRMNISHV